MTESAVLFGRTSSLVGIITRPAASVPTPPVGAALTGSVASTPAPRIGAALTGSVASTPAAPIGAILLDAGLTHRVGPNRIHVKIARRLADEGCPVLRFDFSGIGDSEPSRASLVFADQCVTDTRDAMDHLQASLGVERFLLMGICSGANVAMRTALVDSRVAGVALVNGGWGSGGGGGGSGSSGGADERGVAIDRSSFSQPARIRARYYRSRLADPRSWLRVLSGKSDFRAMRKTAGAMVANIFGRSRSEPPTQGSATQYSATHVTGLDRHPLLVRGVRMLVVCSEGSVAWDTFSSSKASGLFRSADPDQVELVEMKHTDHLFTLLWSQARLIETLCQWASRATAPPTIASDPKGPISSIVPNAPASKLRITPSASNPPLDRTSSG